MLLADDPCPAPHSGAEEEVGVVQVNFGDENVLLCTDFRARADARERASPDPPGIGFEADLHFAFILYVRDLAVFDCYLYQQLIERRDLEKRLTNG
jgi:hypothetical protein